MTPLPPGPPPPPPPEPEARLTALLLGELSPEETAAVHAELAARPDQVELLARLARTLPLVREAMRTPLASPSAAPSAPLRLSPQRRQSLLATFQKVTPLPASAASARPARRLSPWLALAALFAVLLVAAGLLLPALSPAKSKSTHISRLERQRLAEMERLEENLSIEQVPQPPAPATAAPPQPAAPAGAATALGLERTESLGRSLARPEAPGRTLASSPAVPARPDAALPTEAAQAASPTAANIRLMRRYSPAPPADRAPAEAGGVPAAGRVEGGGATPVLGDQPRLGQVFEAASTASSLSAAKGGAFTEETREQAGAPAEARALTRYGLRLPSSAAGEGVVRFRQEAPPAAPAAGLAGARGAEVGESLSARAVTAAADATGAEEEADQRVPAPDRAMFFEAAGAERVSLPEMATADDPFSTFSLNVSDVSFRLAAASLEAGRLPEPGSVRVEEFLNALDYRDPAPPPGAPLALHWERARHPFAHARELVRFSVRTAAAGREPGRALNLVVLLDRSGSMERADRVATSRELLRLLAAQLQPADRLSVVTFARTARLYAEAVPGPEAGSVLEAASALTPEGGTHLEDALRLGYAIAARHFLPAGVNRVILITDGAANLGEVMPDSLKQLVEDHRRRGLALDCFGVGWEDYNDELLEVLARHGDGRYGFLNAPEEAAGFAARLAGALQVAARDVKVQVEFNPARVTRWRLIGYAKDRLTAEQFRDDTVDAAELGAAEAGNALYALEVNTQGAGPLGIFRVRYREPATGRTRELAWTLDYRGSAPELTQGGPALRLAAAAALFGEWLARSPHAAEVTPSGLLPLLEGVPEAFAPDPRPAQLVRMLQLARQLAGP